MAAQRHATLFGWAGRAAWIAEDPSQYLSIATSLASDRAALTQAQIELIDGVGATPLCDIERYAKSLSDCFRAMAG